jgi:CCR4-NOT transcription complex subunit 3
MLSPHRYRDQVKSWIQGTEVKDKTSLEKYRKLIESKMEQFKVCEKETKTKAYSKEGLAQGEKLDPEVKARMDLMDEIGELISKLKDQVEAIEYALESAGSEVGGETATHKWHIDKMEQILRLLDNDEIDYQSVAEIKDDMEYYVESNQEEDFMLDDGLYDSLNLEEKVREAAIVVETKKETGKKDKKGKKEKDKKKADDDEDSAPPPSAKAAPVVEDPEPVKPAPVVAAPVAKVPAKSAAAVVAAAAAPAASVPAASTAPAAGTAAAQKEAQRQQAIKSREEQIKKERQEANQRKLEEAARQQQLRVAAPEKAAEAKKPEPLSAASRPAAEEKRPEEAYNKVAAVPAATVPAPPAPAVADPVFSTTPAAAVSRPPLGAESATKGTAANAAPGKNDLYSMQLAALNSSFNFMPRKPDGVRNKRYAPTRPCAHTPPSFPMEIPSAMEHLREVTKFDKDTLFFIFYYQNHPYHQWLVSKELKRRSWRFHKKYSTWFQRYEEPVISTDEYEKGTSGLE